LQEADEESEYSSPEEFDEKEGITSSCMTHYDPCDNGGYRRGGGHHPLSRHAPLVTRHYTLPISQNQPRSYPLKVVRRYKIRRTITRRKVTRRTLKRSKPPKISSTKMPKRAPRPKRPSKSHSHRKK